MLYHTDSFGGLRPLESCLQREVRQPMDEPFMPDWVIDLRNNGYEGPYGTKFYNWWYSEPTAYKALAESVCQQVMEFLGNRTVWNALPYKFRANLEEEFDRHMEQFEEWLMETYPKGVPC